MELRWPNRHHGPIRLDRTSRSREKLEAAAPCQGRRREPVAEVRLTGLEQDLGVVPRRVFDGGREQQQHRLTRKAATGSREDLLPRDAPTPGVLQIRAATGRAVQRARGWCDVVPKMTFPDRRTYTVLPTVII